MEEKLMIIDTDCGCDDAAALMLALCNQEYSTTVKWHILAITTVSGNVGLDCVNPNVLRVLNICNQKTIPVYAGSKDSLMKNDVKANCHGYDGLGGISNDYSTGGMEIQEESAIFKMIELVKKNKNKVTLVTLGPLTNVALAHRIDSEFTSNLEQIFAMGGNAHGVGNITAAAEFNFYCDPEAANIVITEAQCKVTLYPWEVCKDERFSWSWEMYDKWVEKSNTKSNFLRKMNEKNNKLLKSKQAKFHCCDMFAMAAIIDESIIKEVLHLRAGVETTGKLSKGMLMLDKRITSNAHPNVYVITNVNAARIYELACEMTNQ